jgi:SAM-dependent methyltransferase
LLYPDASFDACVSTLAIDLIPEVDEVAAEMRRVTRPGGVVACGVMDFWGGFSAQDLVYDTGFVLDEGISALRDYFKARPRVWANGQSALTGLTDVIEVRIVLSFDYSSFDDYWSSWSTGPTRVGQRIAALPAVKSSDMSAPAISPAYPTVRGHSPSLSARFEAGSRPEESVQRRISSI